MRQGTFYLSRLNKKYELLESSSWDINATQKSC